MEMINNILATKQSIPRVLLEFLVTTKNFKFIA